MSNRTKNYVWLVVALLALSCFVCRIRWNEFIAEISDVSWPGIILAMFMLLCAQTILASRWLILLRVHQISISFYQAVKLTYLGLFYNNVMPGAVGGDLLKAWFIRNHCDRTRRIEAVVTVFIDRLAGLASMILVGAIASCFVGSELRTIFGLQVRSLIWGILGAFVLGAMVFLSPHIRRILMLRDMLARLPFARQLRRIDSAVRLYRHHMLTVLLAILITTVTQGLVVVAIWRISQSLHLDNVRFVQCLAIMPIIWLVSAVIPVPGGLGVMEYLFIPFFAQAIDPLGAIDPAAGTLGATVVAQAATLALLNRLVICVSSLPGALVPVLGGHVPKAREMQLELEQVTHI